MASATFSSEAELPNYADVTGSSRSIPYLSESPPESQFKTGLQDEKGYAWLTLQMNSRSLTTASAPSFMEGDSITGVVHLDAEKTDSVKAVYIEVLATTTTVGQEPERFLALKETLWSTEKATKASAKLMGKHDWPFQFTLPKEVEVTGPRGKKGFYQLPPSFSERASPAYLDYKIVVTIKRGMLKVNQKLTTTMLYQPLTVPASTPTSLRTLAYTEGKPIPGPKLDPEGWKLLQKRPVEGVLFGERDVEINVQLSLATPVQYALGSPIPLHLILESEDSQALDLLSSPAAIQVALTRAITIGSEAAAEDPERRTNNYITTVESKAYFWSAQELGEGPNRRVLQGEIDLEMKTKPTFIFPGLSIEYLVNFEGFEATGWQAKSHDSRAKGPLFTEEVKITSRQLAGLSMRSNAPPGYQRPVVDYNKSLGYLENGNQRFVHYGHR
ncbi:hypothetical protein Agabi119p4_7503 [Agaricus bisporus var. burnettii]|uniref:Arrestin-like N-terminal domain-containing protein n=1 Tax=Agaricus bisporus var. burnettii TaxID=192524 RepID=A0A8H7EZK6_AGABI|nr:hypothetical protein Agabi119p4_7503 [Agaricus bisporus var. burnettii]